MARVNFSSVACGLLVGLVRGVPASYLAEPIEVAIEATDGRLAVHALVFAGRTNRAALAAEQPSGHEVAGAPEVGVAAGATLFRVGHVGSSAAFESEATAFCTARAKRKRSHGSLPMGHHSDMVRINRVYTRAGDDGTTALGGGQRVKKDSLRIEAYGTVDELNSSIGLAVASGLHESLYARFFVIQQVLFNVGSDLCILEEDKKRFAVPGVEARHVTDLETWMDEWNEGLEPLKSFILPGGDLAAAQLHVARTVCRRAERATIALSRDEAIGAHVIPYLNRLSDLLFVASRYQAKLVGKGDLLWDSHGY